MKFLIILVAAAALIWFGMNFDFDNFKPNTTNTMKQEKTILKVNQGREQQQKDIENAVKF